MRFVAKYMFFLLLMIISLQAFPQSDFYAAAIPDVVYKDDIVSYRVVVENSRDVKGIVPPDFKNFYVVGGPSEESGMSRVNGSVTRYIAYTFYLKPKKAGVFVLPPAEAIINGKKSKCNNVRVTVSKSANIPSVAMSSGFNNRKSSFNASDYIIKSNESVDDKVKKNMFLRLSLSKHECYVGEPVVATYKLYTRLKSDSRLLQNPSFNGFSVVDLQPADVTAFENDKIDGRDFNVYTIRKAQLYPLQAGTFQVEKAELENTVQFIKESSEYAQRDDLVEAWESSGFSFDPSDIAVATVNLSSKTDDIVIKPLPEKNKPASFNGAVGTFTIDAEMKSSSFALNEAGVLRITIKGNGNLQLLTAPQVIWPEGIESFEPHTVDKLSMNDVPVSGSRIFEFTFSADKTGKFSIPPVAFSYFDPSTGVYKTIKTQPFSFDVTSAKPGVTSPKLAKASVAPAAAWQNRLLENRSLLAIIIATIIGLCVIIYVIRTRKHNDVSVTHDVIDEMSEIQKIENPLQQSEACLQSPDCLQFCTILNSEMRSFLAAKLGTSPQLVSARIIDTFIEKNHLPNVIAVELQQLFYELELRLYTPSEHNEQMALLYSRALAVVQSLKVYA